MACALNDDVPRVETSLFQRQQEIIRLRAIDDVVLGTMPESLSLKLTCRHTAAQKRMFLSRTSFHRVSRGPDFYRFV
jgi:hypothetical protein